MATMTIRAPDSAQALDEVMRCLGPDALILSTRQHKGQVEIIAAPAGGVPSPALASAEPIASAATFSGQLLRQIANAPQRAGVLPPHLPGRVVLAGPPGSGRSTLAARLAAEALRNPTAARPTLIAPRPDLLSPPGRLAAHARLLGLAPHRPIWRPEGPIDLRPPAPDETQILDLSDLPQIAPTRLSDVCAHADAALWLVLPTGLHPAVLERLCAQFAGMARHLVLTRTDLCAPTPDDLSIPARHDLSVALLAGGGGLLDALTAVSAVTSDDLATTDNPEPDSKELPDASARLS